MGACIKNNYNEIQLTKPREDVKIQKNFLIQLNSENIIKESMLCTLNKLKNKNDVAYVEYTSNEEQNRNNNPLNEIFCDNNIVITSIEDR